MSTFYLTTPIYYPNARPHVGSAYTTIVCDVLARYKRMCGYDVAFLTGTDEHGEKLQRAASEAGKSPREFVAEKRQLFIDLWKKLGIDPVVYPYEEGVAPGVMRFVYTDHPDQFKSVRRMLLRARANKIDGQEIIYKKRYEGRYCIFDEMYVSEVSDPINCPNCGRPTELISEENYFFRLSAFKDRLLTHYEKNPDFVRPDFRVNEVKNFVKDLRDISISRKRIRWGIPFPLDEDHDDPEQVFYVWYDALVSYMTGIGYAEGEDGGETFQKYWRNSRGSGSVELRASTSELVHMVGKDILRFHAVYWPAFIMAAYPDQSEMLPTTVFAHGWIYYEQDKMSKSKGNVVYPEPIIDAFESFGAPGNDALRYYLLREAPFGHDTSFSYEALIQRYNSDLANDLGNLASRTLSMIRQYFMGIVPWPPQNLGQGAQVLAEIVSTDVLQTRSGLNYRGLFDTFSLSAALQIISNLVTQTNKYLVREQPWLGSDSSRAPSPSDPRNAPAYTDPSSTSRGEVLYSAAEALRFVALLTYPIMPASAQRLWQQLGGESSIEDQRFSDLKWGGLKPGTKVGKPEPIFPRLDKIKALARLEEYAEADRERGRPKGVTITVPSQEQSAVRSGQSAVPSPEPQVPSPAGQLAVGRPQSLAGRQQSTIDNRQSTIAAPAKITIDDFAKVEMVVGQIVSAEAIPGAQKLLKLQVDIGAETRQVCAGIAEFYKPEEVTGMKIVLVANLEPRKLRGVESNGMVVAASIGPEGRPVLATFKEDVPNGTRLK
jgi:methionyl-tRNA synthetase